MLGWYSKCFPTDSAIFIDNAYQLYKFSLDGKFICKIGVSGRGPGEIDLIRAMSVLEKQSTIVVQKNGESELLYFSFEGQFLKSVKIPAYFNVNVLDDGNYIVYDPGSFGFEKFNFILTNEKGDTISTIDNYYTFTNPDNSGMIMYHYFEPFYFYNNSYYFKTLYNDTIYYSQPYKKSIQPGYYINMGKFKLPPDLRVEAVPNEDLVSSNIKRRNYYFSSPFETSNLIFITSAPFTGNMPRYLLYNKLSANGTLLVNEEKENSGFINDWDGGVDFWPIGSFNENQIYMIVNILDLKKKLESNKSGLEPFTKPDAQKHLEKIVSISEVTDNPLLMIVTLKE